MGKRIFLMAFIGVVLCSFTLSYAATMAKDEYKRTMQDLKDQLVQARKDCVKAKDDLSDQTLMQLKKTSPLLKDKAARDKIMLDDRAKRAAISDAYNGKVRNVMARIRELKGTNKEHVAPENLWGYLSCYFKQPEKSASTK